MASDMDTFGGGDEKKFLLRVTTLGEIECEEVYAAYVALSSERINKLLELKKNLEPFFADDTYVESVFHDSDVVYFRDFSSEKVKERVAGAFEENEEVDFEDMDRFLFPEGGIVEAPEDFTCSSVPMMPVLLHVRRYGVWWSAHYGEEASSGHIVETPTLPWSSLLDGPSN